MSDELPTEERLRRIEHGVRRRIDARRATAHRVRQGVTGGLVVVLLLGGGAALLRSAAVDSASSSSAGSAAGSSAAVVAVQCHDGRTATTVRAARAGLPASALRACTAATFGARAQPEAASGSSASTPPTAPPRVLCRAEDGALHVYLGAAAACTAHGMTTYPG